MNDQAETLETVMRRYNIDTYDYDPMELDRNLFEELWVEYVVNHDQKERKVVMKQKIRSRINELYSMIRKLEKAKKKLVFNLNTTKLSEVISVLKRNMNHWRIVYLMKCSCCANNYKNLGEYLSHNCCEFNCKKMDIFNEPPTKKPKHDFVCPGCEYSCSRLIDYLSHSCDDERRMDIFFEDAPLTTDQPKIKPKSILKRTKFMCSQCKRFYASKARLNAHIKVCQSSSFLEPSDNVSNIPSFQLNHTAFKGRFRVYVRHLKNMIDLDLVKKDNHYKIRDLLLSCIEELGPIKYMMFINIVFQKMDSSDLVGVNIPSIFKPLLLGDNIHYSIDESFLEVKEVIDQYTEKGSGFWIMEIPELSIWVGKYKPHRGGCFREKLPKSLANKKCLVSIECSSDCFLYSILCALYGVKNPNRQNQYLQYMDNSNFTEFYGEVEFDKIEKFEKKNDISVSVFTYDTMEKCVVPICITKSTRSKHVRLFWYKNHYYTIKDFQRLLNRRSGWYRAHCERCLTGFRHNYQLERHMMDCSNKPVQKIVMPTPNENNPRRNFCERSDFKKEVKHPIIIYCDFECLSVPTDNPAKPFQHIPCSYGYVVVDWQKKIIDKRFRHGVDIVKDFLINLKISAFNARNYIKQSQKPLIMSPIIVAQMDEATHCWICSKLLKDDRVADHDHFTGEFRGAAHNKCNVNYQIPTRIPVFFHNLKNYDGHLIIDTVNSKSFSNNLKIIPTTIEKYIGWYVDDFAFLDSFGFLSTSLETLSNNLTKEQKEEFLKQEWPDMDLTELMGKAAIPYEYLTSLDKFEDPCLPPKEVFYSSLNDSYIDDDKYERLERIWKQFNCSKLGDIIDIYLRLDVIMLAAIFENFRITSITDFGIDPPHYMSCPGLAFAASLKMLKISIELFTQIDMLLMVEKGIRGGFTTVAKRHAIAYNSGVANYIDGDQTHILYFDVNNLYGGAMIDVLPLGKFEWCNWSEESSFLSHVLEVPDDDVMGYILEVDLSYPDCLHDLHNDFPLAPHRMKIDATMLSPYAKELLNELNEQGTSPSSSEKLVSTFLPRARYVLHYRNLKYYIKAGLIVTKIHRAITFVQKAWLKPYIEFCTQKRQQAKDNFTSSLYKLFVNSVYGKLMEDKRKHMQVDLVMSEKIATKRVSNPFCKQFKILNEDKILIQKKPEKVLMDKAIVSGFTVLELSKLRVYKLYYDHFKSYYGERIKLIYSDTDSFIVEIKTNTLIDDMKKFANIMDFSDLPVDNPLYDDCNKKRIGCLKDEMAGEVITEVIAIKPKLYVIKTAEKEKKRAKGVQKCVVDKKLTFNDYKNSLYSETSHKELTRRLGSSKHKISMYLTEKIAISPFEDKRYLLPDKINSFAYGHYSIK